MSAITSAEIDSTTARVVARPTPSAPPVTEKPVLTPTSVMSAANTKLFARPCPMSQGSSEFSVCTTYAPMLTSSVGEQ